MRNNKTRCRPLTRRSSGHGGCSSCHKDPCGCPRPRPEPCPPPPCPPTPGDQTCAFNVANVAELRDVVDASLSQGCEVFVRTVLQPFALDKTSQATPDGITVVDTQSGIGRWLRVRRHAPKWTNQADWWVDAINGNDENPGSLNFPVKSCREIAERLMLMKFSPFFGPYVINLLSDIPNTDSAQFSGLLDPLPGDIDNNPDLGVTRPVIVVRGQARPTGQFGVVDSYNVADGCRALLTRKTGEFALNDVAEFTSGAANGIRFIPATAGATTTINEAQLGGAVPEEGDTFRLLRLTKLAIQFSWVGNLQNPRVAFEECWVPGDGQNNTFADDGPGTWEVTGAVLRYTNCLINQIIRPSLSGRTQFRAGTGVIFPSHESPANITIQRGGNVSNSSATFVNAVLDVMIGAGQLLHINCLNVGGAIRGGGGLLEKEDTGGGAPWILLEGLRAFDWPAFIPPNPFTLSGGVGDVGAALCLGRAAFASIAAGFCGYSDDVGTYGLNIYASAKLEIQPNVPGSGNPTPTVTGQAGDIIFDSGAPFPHWEDVFGGIQVTPLTSWADFIDANTFNNNTVNLRSGTTIFTASGPQP